MVADLKLARQLATKAMQWSYAARSALPCLVGNVAVVRHIASPRFEDLLSIPHRNKSLHNMGSPEGPCTQQSGAWDVGSSTYSTGFG